MTSRHWQIFVSVADCGTMSEAARTLGITQPSISQAIGDIEKEYGVLLFARVNKRLRLTETGREFLPYAKRVLALEKEVDEFLRNAADMTRIRIGTSVTVGTCLMPRLGGELSFRVPGIRLEVVVNNTEYIENQLLNGELDIGLVEGDINHSDLKVETVIDDNLVVICGTNHPLCGKKTVTLEEVAGHNLILREKGSGTRAQLEDLLRERGLRADVTWECCNTEAVLNAVSNGYGVSVLSGRLVSDYGRRHQVWAAEISDATVNRGFSLVYHKDKLMNREMVAFCDICREFGKGELHI